MNLTAAGVTGSLRWAVINRAFDGEALSGDRHVVCVGQDGTIVGVIDGLGHGREAATAAARAAETIEQTSGDVGELLRACHAALARTRGAVLSLARFHAEHMSWVGVGNVEGLLLRRPGSGPESASGAKRRERLSLIGGVVGHVLPNARPVTLPIARGDLIVLVTDGLRSDAVDGVDALASPERVVESLMTRSRTGRDDALAFAARYDGGAS